jgi:transcriptional regulator with XRE-family HTH domain
MRLVISLKTERLERGLTQRDMADEVGVSQSTWSRAEKGENVNPSAAKKIADFLERKPKEVWDFGEVAA